jgi:hypothetical protein
MKKFMILALALTVPVQAYAYFDPGTGSLIIQALIGALAAVTVFWGRVKMYVTSLFSKPEQAPTSAAASESVTTEARPGGHEESAP